MRGTETVTLIPSGGMNSDGDPLPAGAEVDIRACITWPRTSTEDASQGERIIDGLNVYMPPAAPAVSPLDKIRARGVVWDVDGVPGVYLGKGTLVVLKRAGT